MVCLSGQVITGSSMIPAVTKIVNSQLRKKKTEACEKPQATRVDVDMSQWPQKYMYCRRMRDVFLLALAPMRYRSKKIISVILIHEFSQRSECALEHLQRSTFPWYIQAIHGWKTQQFGSHPIVCWGYTWNLIDKDNRAHLAWILTNTEGSKFSDYIVIQLQIKLNCMRQMI